MKPCIMCNTLIKKTDSKMVTVNICSEECMLLRKSRLPKKKTLCSIEYWTGLGLSINEAKEKISLIQKKRSPRSVDYWINKGYSINEANEKVSNFQSSIGKQNLVNSSHEERQMRSPFSTHYWTKQGYSEEEAKHILTINSDGTSLDFHIRKYGIEEGTAKYNSLCEHRSVAYTLDGYIKTHGECIGEELWSRKFKNRHNSKIATEFFKMLSDQIYVHKIFTAGNDNGEYGVLDKTTNTYYFYDFVVPSLSLCVEFQGDYWHCNPDKFDKSYFHKQARVTAQQIWEKDKAKQDCMRRERKIETIVVWESSDVQTALRLIMEKVNEYRY